MKTYAKQATAQTQATKAAKATGKEYEVIAVEGGFSFQEKVVAPAPKAKKEKAPEGTASIVLDFDHETTNWLVAAGGVWIEKASLTRFDINGTTLKVTGPAKYMKRKFGEGNLLACA